MFYENRGKKALMKGSLTDRRDHDDLRKTQTGEIQSASSDLYQTILEGNSTTLLKKKRNLTFSKRLSVLKKDYKKNRMNQINGHSDEEAPPQTVGLPSPRMTQKKRDKIKELFIQIIKDQDEGIKSPGDINSSYRKVRVKKLKKPGSILLPVTKTSSISNIYQVIGESNLNTERKYKFLSSDSKFDEIMNLKKQNAQLKKEIASLESELTGKNDVFQRSSLMSLSDPQSQAHLQEKRLLLLKNQTTKQRRYIKTLQRSLRLMKKFYRDMTSILLLFRNLDHKYSEMLRPNEKFVQKRSRNTTRNDNSFIQELDEKTKADALRQILHGAKNADLLEKFIANFNEAYEKVKGFQRKNEELKKMFEITDAEITKDYREKAKKIKYNYLLREFIGKYQKYLPIKTFFETLEPKDKDSIDTHMTNIIKLMGKIEEVFKQINTFDRIQKNPFFNQSSIPENLRENAGLFESFLAGKSKNPGILLNYNSVSELESNLNGLLREITVFQISLDSKEEFGFDKVLGLQRSLRESVDKLLEFGAVLTEAEDPLPFLHSEAGLLAGMNINEKKFAGEPGSFKANIYKGESSCNNDFQRIYSFLQESATELEEALSPKLEDQQIKKLHNFKVYLLTLNRLYEQKKITSFLKDLDLSMQSQRLEIINKGFDSLKFEIFEKIKSFDDFFQNMEEKVLKLGQHFDAIFENVNEEKKKVVFDHSRKVQGLFKFMSLNIERRMGQKEFNEMNLNLSSLDEEYKVKVKVIEDKWNSFTKRIAGILEMLNQNQNNNIIKTEKKN